MLNRLLKTLWNSNGNKRSRNATFRPQLEGLGDRFLPSTTGLGPMVDLDLADVAQESSGLPGADAPGENGPDGEVRLMCLQPGQSRIGLLPNQCPIDGYIHDCECFYITHADAGGMHMPDKYGNLVPVKVDHDCDEYDCHPGQRCICTDIHDH